MPQTNRHTTQVTLPLPGGPRPLGEFFVCFDDRTSAEVRIRDFDMWIRTRSEPLGTDNRRDMSYACYIN